MARLNNGGINGKAVTQPTSTTASGKWNISEHGVYASRNIWVDRGVVATGGTEATVGSYKIHTFTTVGSNTFQVTRAPAGTVIDVLVVAGGGTGGAMASGQTLRGAGGGAGGLIYISSFPITTASYSVTVGRGGNSNSGTTRENGLNSVFSGSGRTLTAIGGGAGAQDDNTNNAGTGGSGGGSWYPGYVGAASTQPVNTNDGITIWNSTGFGNSGGTSSSSQPYGGGGGGAGAAGGNWNGPSGPIGGIGRQYDISGTMKYYSGGGGCAGFPGAAGYAEYPGGLGGGGTGSNDAYNVISNGEANTGGGGGSGGSGGSGIVIVRYLV